MSSRQALTFLSICPAVVTIAFGVWHFFVPSAWEWWSYISPDSPELVLAVRAINILFSLALVLIGAAVVLIVTHRPFEPFATSVVLAIAACLWAARTVVQLAYPQGSQVAGLSETMLSIFALTCLGFATAATISRRVRPPDGGSVDCAGGAPGAGAPQIRS